MKDEPITPLYLEIRQKVGEVIIGYFRDMEEADMESEATMAHYIARRLSEDRWV